MRLVGDGEVRGELVVLLDVSHRPVGTAPKAEVHTASTPLHLAFSAYLFDGAGRFLLTRRAVDKRTFPGVWSNSACGHPAPGEDLEGAVRRRVGTELGVALDGLRCVLPEFSYRATDTGGIVENEFCPVFTATTTDVPDPDPDEVEGWAWIAWADMVSAATAAPHLLSPWSVLQIARLVDADFTPPAQLSSTPEGQPTVSAAGQPAISPPDQPTTSPEGKPTTSPEGQPTRA